MLCSKKKIFSAETSHPFKVPFESTLAPTKALCEVGPSEGKFSGLKIEERRTELGMVHENALVQIMIEIIMMLLRVNCKYPH